MHFRVGRLVAAGERLKTFVETSREATAAERSFMVMNWDAALGVLFDDADLPDATQAQQLTRDFDYLAFDSGTRSVIGFGPRAVFALQNADEAAPNSAISILYAGNIGRWMWEEKFSLDVAWKLIGARLRPSPGLMVPDQP